MGKNYVEKPGYGCVIEPPDERDYDYDILAGGSTTPLPKSFSVDVPWHFYQNGIDCCVGSAIAAAKSVQEGKKLSVRFLWGEAKKRQNYTGWGAYIGRTIQVLMEIGTTKHGVLDEEVVGVDRDDYMRYEMTPQLLDQATPNRAESYWRAFGLDSIKRALLNEEVPLITSMQWHTEYDQPGKGGLLRPGSTPAFGHAFIFTGWGTKNGRPALKFKNSWRETWGDKGSFWVYEDEFPAFKMGSFHVLTDIPQTKASIIAKYSGKLIRNPDRPEHYYVSKTGGKIAWIKNEPSFEFGRDEEWWGNWGDVITIDDKIEYDIIY